MSGTEHSPVSASAQLAAAVGIDLAVEIQADLFDSLIFPGVGDILRNVWRDIRADLIRTPARLSGAAHELEFYGRPAMNTDAWMDEPITVTTTQRQLVEIARQAGIHALQRGVTPEFVGMMFAIALKAKA